MLLDVSERVFVLLESGSVPLFILLVNKRNAPFTLLFRISLLNLDGIFSILIWLFVDGSLSCMVLLSFTSSLVFPSSHNLSLFSGLSTLLGGLLPLTFYFVLFYLLIYSLFNVDV